MNKVYERNENGSVTTVSVKEAMVEVNFAMMEGKHSVRQMSSARGRHQIEYKDGRKVRLVLVDAPEPTETDNEGRRIVTVKGKRYVVGTITPARPKTGDSGWWVPEAYACYWSAGALGLPSGPTRSARASMKPGTVGRAIWDAVNR